jgi:hypothetical protein
MSLMLRISSETGGKLACRGDWLLHSLVVRRAAPSSLRMIIRSIVEGAKRPRQQVIEQIRTSSRPACYAESLRLWLRKSRNFPVCALGAGSRANQITWPNNELPRRKQLGILFPSDAVIPCLTQPAPYLIRGNPVCFSGYRLSPV